MNTTDMQRAFLFLPYRLQTVIQVRLLNPERTTRNAGRTITHHSPIAGATAIGICATRDMMKVAIMAAMQVEAMRCWRTSATHKPYCSSKNLHSEPTASGGGVLVCGQLSCKYISIFFIQVFTWGRKAGRLPGAASSFTKAAILVCAAYCFAQTMQKCIPIKRCGKLACTTLFII